MEFVDSYRSILHPRLEWNGLKVGIEFGDSCSPIQLSFTPKIGMEFDDSYSPIQLVKLRLCD